VALGDMFGVAKAAQAATDRSAGRLGWFEGVREDRICGWTYDRDRPHAALDVTIAVADGGRLTVPADRLRADLQSVDASGGYHGFSAPIALLPGAERGATCVWSDSGFALPGSPWAPPRRGGRRFGSGSVVLELDPPVAGDPRLTGYAWDRRQPLRRVSLRARSHGEDVARTLATLYRPEARSPGDRFHGFALGLPAPLRMLADGLEIIDDDLGRSLARLGPKSL
jgi:hypothetical protein